MSPRLMILAASLLVLCAAHAEPGSAANPLVVMETSKGPITIELFSAEAPASSANFLAYVRKGFYADTIFHRVIPGFVVQGGGFTADMVPKPTANPIVNEADNGLTNLRGTLAMARTSDPNSADSQFFINLTDNDFLNHRDKTPRGWGYAVFARVVKGMDVVDAIAASATGVVGGMPDVPLEAVVVTAASVVGDDAE